MPIWRRTNKVDSIADVNVFIDWVHHRIHEGDMWYADAVKTAVECAVALITPPAYPAMHLSVSWASEGAAHFELVQDATWDISSGTQVPIYNRNHNSTDSSEVLEDSTGSVEATDNVILTPTNITGGTIKCSEYSWGKKDAGQGGNFDSAEFILKRDTRYVFRVVSDAGVQGQQVHLLWYH